MRMQTQDISLLTRTSVLFHFIYIIYDICIYASLKKPQAVGTDVYKNGGVYQINNTILGWNTV